MASIETSGGGHVTGLPEVRPEVVALWLGSDPMAASEAGRLVHRDGAPFTDAELDLAWSFTADERAVVLERAELRLAEAEAMLADAAARHKAAKRAKYRDYRRRRGDRRGRIRARPPPAGYRSGP